MKIYKNPKRYQFQFDDHSFSTGCPILNSDIERIVIDPVVIELTGWLLAEDKKAYIIATSKEDHNSYCKYDEIWTVLKVKELSKVRCND